MRNVCPTGVGNALALSYHDLERLWNACEDKLADNTYIVPRDWGFERDVFAVRLHQTDIYAVTPENVHYAYTGGWRTKLTMSRLNQYTHLGFRSVSNLWFVSHKEEGEWSPIGMFEEGMAYRLYPFELVEPVSGLITPSHALGTAKKIKKILKAYVDNIPKSFHESLLQTLKQRVVQLPPHIPSQDHFEQCVLKGLYFDLPLLVLMDNFIQTKRQPFIEATGFHNPEDGHMRTKYYLQHMGPGAIAQTLKWQFERHLATYVEEVIRNNVDLPAVGKDGTSRRRLWTAFSDFGDDDGFIEPVATQ